MVFAFQALVLALQALVLAVPSLGTENDDTRTPNPLGSQTPNPLGSRTPTPWESNSHALGANLPRLGSKPPTPWEQTSHALGVELPRLGRRRVIIANLLRCYRIRAWSCTSVHSLRPRPQRLASQPF